MGYILHCFNCFHRETAKASFAYGLSLKCPECGSKMDYAGPLWLGKIADKDFLKKMRMETEHKRLKNMNRIRKILTLIGNELEAPITYYVIDKICDKLDLPAVSIKKVYENLKRDGFKASPTHFEPKGLRANAPAKTIVELLQKLYVKKENIRSFK
jgi:tRNA (guanine26-N2/guanine27-N2)-dimethyltransferase